jgi:hypothetical protein
MSFTTLLLMTFPAEIIYSFKMLFEVDIFLKFKFWIIQIKSHEKMTKMKIVDLEKLYNFFIWDHFVKENYVWISQIWNLNFSNDLGWRNNKNESCRSGKVKELCSWQFFRLRSFCQGKLRLNFSNLKFNFFKRPRMEKPPKRKL